MAERPDPYALLPRITALWNEFWGLFSEAVEVAGQLIRSDPYVQQALDPNNEYVQYDNPLMWEELMQEGRRSNYFKRTFRFEGEHIQRLAQALRLPEVMHLSQKKGSIEGRLGLAILLNWLAFPKRQENDMEGFWRRERRLLNVIIDDVACFIFKTWRHLLWPGDVTRIRENAQRWATIISTKVGIEGEPAPVFGFMDGTKRETCKPGGPFPNQQAVWDGHHNMPALGYLGVNSPDGIFILFYGPFVGWVNDHSMLMTSRLHELMDEGVFGEGLCVYGDQGFYIGPGIWTGYSGAAPGSAEDQFNHKWNGQRTSVEWGFGKVANTFRTHDFTPLQKPNLSRIGVWYLVSVLLTNCQVCLYGSQAAGHFQCPPPTLEEYLRAEWHEDPAFAEVYDRYRPCMYPFRLKEEKLTRWNTGKWEWEVMQRYGREEMDPTEVDEVKDEEGD